MALSAQVGLYGRPPAQCWEYYSRLKRRASVEAAAVPVAAYAKKLAEPKTADIESFFEAHKNQYARPDSPEPGFRVPHRIAVQYFRGNTDKFADPKTITEAQIKEEYEKQKEMYDRFEAMLPEKPLTEKEEKKPEAAASPKQGKPSAEEKRPPVLQQSPPPGERDRNAAVESRTGGSEEGGGRGKIGAAAGRRSLPERTRVRARLRRRPSGRSGWFRIPRTQSRRRPRIPRQRRLETTSPLPPGTASCRKQRRRRSRSPRAPKPARLRQPRRN